MRPRVYYRIININSKIEMNFKVNVGLVSSIYRLSGLIGYPTPVGALRVHSGAEEPTRSAKRPWKSLESSPSAQIILTNKASRLVCYPR